MHLLNCFLNSLHNWAFLQFDSGSSSVELHANMRVKGTLSLKSEAARSWNMKLKFLSETNTIAKCILFHWYNSKFKTNPPVSHCFRSLQTVWTPRGLTADAVWNWDWIEKACSDPERIFLRYGNYYAASAFPIKEIPQSSWAKPNSCLSIIGHTHTPHTLEITWGFTLTPVPSLHFSGDQLLASLSQWQVDRPLRGRCVTFYK